VLVLQVGGQELRFVALTPGAFWKRAEVRDLIPVYRRQPVPMWPYVDCTFLHKPPFGVNWERPYLDWDPDEAWLREEMEPAATAEPGVPAAPAAAAAPATRVQGTAATGATAPPEGFTGATLEAPPPG